MNFSVNTMHKIQYGIGMEVWKIAFHSILEIFHSIPFWHLPYSLPKFPFHSIFHSIPYHALLKIRERLLRRICFGIRKNNTNFYASTICVFFFEGRPQGICLQCFPPKNGPAAILRLLFPVT